MNTTVKDLTVTGKIIFPDGTFLDSSYSSLFSNFLNFQRNPALGTTTLLNDKLLVSNVIETASDVLTPTLKSQSIHFLNDDDINGIPLVQTKAFSDSLKTELQTNTSQLNSLITDHFDRPNKRMRVTDSTNTSTYAANFININLATYSDTGITIPSGTFSMSKGAAAPRITLTDSTVQLSVDSADSQGSIKITKNGEIRIDPSSETVVVGSMKIIGTLVMTLPGRIQDPSFTGTVTFAEANSVSGLNKNHVGLGNADNTSDLNKPISTATQTALNLKANLASPTFTGTLTASQIQISNSALTLLNMINSSSLAGYFMGVATSNGQFNGMVQTNDNLIMAKGAPSGSSTGNGEGFGKLVMATWSSFRNGIKITANETFNAALQTWQDVGNKIEIECGTCKYTQNATGVSLNGNLAITGTVTGVTKSMVGLSNVDDTSDLNKPVSTATQTALNLKANLASPTFTGTVSGVTKSMVGLSNVDNTSDLDKPVSTATQTALNLKANLASPTFTGTVSGITKSMVGLSNVDNTSDTDKPVSTATQSALNLKANLASPTFTGTVSGITKSMVGLSNVDNTSDTDKPVSTATQTALNAKANQSSPSFGGIITMPDGKQQTKAFTDEWEQKVRLLGIGSSATLATTQTLSTETFHNVGSVILPVGFFLVTVHACVAVITGNTTIGQIAAGYSTSNTGWSQTNQLAIQHLGNGTYNVGNQWVLHSTAIVQNTTAKNYYLLVQCGFGTADRLQFVGQNSRFEYMRISNSGLW